MQRSSALTHSPARMFPAERPSPWNPLSADPAARAHSSYHTPGDALPPHSALQQAHAHLSDHVLDAAFPCVGARSAFHRGRCRFGLYPPLAGHDAAAAVCHDLYEFSHEFEQPGGDPVTFVALFSGPGEADEAAFERALWRQLQRMHEIDRRHFAWDDRVSGDPGSAEFSFSLGGRAFFIIGLHPRASRAARRLPCSALAFNLHEQFESLRRHGKYQTMQQVIRRRDLALQGSVNPVLMAFGAASEARQYSGRAHADDWHCPFHRLPSP